MVGRPDRRLRFRERRRQRDELFAPGERGGAVELRRAPHAGLQRGVSAAVRPKRERRDTSARSGVAVGRGRQLRERRSVHAVHRVRLRERPLERSEPAEAGLGARVQRGQCDRRLAGQLVQFERVRAAARRRVRQRGPQLAARSGPEDGGLVGLQEHARRQAEPADPDRDLQPLQPRELRDAGHRRTVRSRRHTHSGLDAHHAHLDDRAPGAVRAEIRVLNAEIVEW